MTDIFISYCMQDAEPAQQLATELEASGYAAGRDAAATAPSDGLNVEMSHGFGAAKAVIAVWSANSIRSEPVLAAAQSALSGLRLIGVCGPGFDVRNVPAEFISYTIGPIVNRTAIYAALDTLGVKARRAASASITEDANALNKRGDNYRFGKAGYSQDYINAARLYRRAAELNNSRAAYNLGVMYAEGRGVARDEAEAVRLYRKAAGLNHPDACLELGDRCVFGDGAAQDYAEAVRFYRLAAQMNNVIAINNLGDMYENGFGVKKDEAEALRLYRQAAGMGGGCGALSLGGCYEKGIGVDKDLDEARRWYLRAIELGVDEAEKRLDNLELSIDEAKEQLDAISSSAGSHAMPEELRDLLLKAKAEVAEHENHELSFGTRKALLRMFGPVLMSADGRSTTPGPGQIRRTRLCIAIVRPFLPLWDKYYAPNRDPKLMLVLAKGYLAGTCPKERLERKAYAFSGGLQNSGPPEEDLAWLTGRASVDAAYVAIRDEILTTDEYVSEDDLLDPQDPDLWDCAFWTAAAAAGGMPWVEGFCKEKYAAFWNYYLDVAIPNAWASLPE